MNTNRNILIFSMLINFMLLFISIKLFFDRNNFFQKKPEFIQQTYSHDSFETQPKFKESVKENFPLGISEIQLVKELANKGFIPGWSYSNQHQAVFITSNIVCHEVWSITWKVNEEGNVTEIDGLYRDICP
ncbi:MAG: hypothetical protein AAF383_22210 [Cyanobacteria bacterium P01_A01_bin.83]